MRIVLSSKLNNPVAETQRTKIDWPFHRPQNHQNRTIPVVDKGELREMRTVNYCAIQTNEQQKAFLSQQR